MPYFYIFVIINNKTAKRDAIFHANFRTWHDPSEYLKNFTLKIELKIPAKKYSKVIITEDNRYTIITTRNIKPYMQSKKNFHRYRCSALLFYPNLD